MFIQKIFYLIIFFLNQIIFCAVKTKLVEELSKIYDFKNSKKIDNENWFIKYSDYIKEKNVSITYENDLKNTIQNSAQFILKGYSSGSFVNRKELFKDNENIILFFNYLYEEINKYFKYNLINEAFLNLNIYLNKDHQNIHRIQNIVLNDNAFLFYMLYSYINIIFEQNLIIENNILNNIKGIIQEIKKKKYYSNNDKIKLFNEITNYIFNQDNLKIELKENEIEIFKKQIDEGIVYYFNQNNIITEAQFNENIKKQENIHKENQKIIQTQNNLLNFSNLKKNNTLTSFNINQKKNNNLFQETQKIEIVNKDIDKFLNIKDFKIEETVKNLNNLIINDENENKEINKYSGLIKNIQELVKKFEEHEKEILEKKNKEKEEKFKNLKEKLQNEYNLILNSENNSNKINELFNELKNQLNNKINYCFENLNNIKENLTKILNNVFLKNDMIHLQKKYEIKIKKYRNIFNIIDLYSNYNNIASEELNKLFTEELN